jgi:hypothetical protein
MVLLTEWLRLNERSACSKTIETDLSAHTRSPMLLHTAAFANFGTCLLLILAFTSAGKAEGLPEVSARPPWTLQDQNDDVEDGYILYKRKPPGSEFDAYRLEAIIDSPPQIVAAAAATNLADPERSQKNMDKKILRNDEEVMIVYSYIHINAPFVSDRDVISHIDRSYDPATDTHILAWRSTDEGPPPIEGVSRLDNSRGSWTFSPEANGKTRAIYFSHTEIQGFVPAWVINVTMRGTMVQGIEGLRETVRLAQQAQ